MKLWICCALVLGLIACAGPQPPTRIIPAALEPYVAVSQHAVLLQGANIHIGDGSAPLKNASLLIVGDKIAAIGPVGTFAVPKNAAVIDLKGASLMPGIIGMHNHTHMPGITLMAYTAPRGYLAAGVTSIQTTGSADALGELALAKAIQRNEVPGPRIIPTAPYITGANGNAVMMRPEDEDAARQFVRDWAKQGVQWIKLYRHTDPAIAGYIIDEAHQHGLKVTGHLCSITYREAALLGIDSIEHGLNAASDFVPDKPAGECVPSKASKRDLDPDGPEIGALIALLIQEGVTITSTLAILETGYPHRPQADARSLKAMSKDLRAIYDARQIRLKESAERTTSTPAYWELLNAFERRFVAAGGRLVAGPDTGRHIFPGFGDQRNFELLVEAGFSVPQVITIMTHNGALALGMGNEIGLLKVGYQADIIVIPEDLMASPTAIRTPKLVFKAGIGYDPAPLLDDITGQMGLR